MAERPESAYPPSWYAATAPQLPLFPALAGNRACDVAVVGGGYTGLSAALHLKLRGYDVVLVEARRVGWGASGRNGGQVHSGQRRDQDYLEAAVGRDDARKLWELGEQAKALIAGLCEAHGIDCDLGHGLLHADHKAHHVAHSRAYVDKLRRAYDYEQADFLDADGVGELVATSGYHGGWLDRGGLHLHPLKLALGLAQAASRAGVAIHELSPVKSISGKDPVRLETPEGTLSARFAVLACNGHFDGLSPPVERRVAPLNNFMIATAPLGDDTARALIRNGIAVSDSRFVVNYYRLSRDGRLLFGGGESYRARFPADIAGLVSRRMRAVFPQLEGVAVDYAWGGTLAITPRRLPFVRKIAANQFTAAGYSGQGVGLALLCGQILAEAIDGAPGRFDLMARLPVPPFPGGRLLRRPLIAAALALYAIRDRL